MKVCTLALFGLLSLGIQICNSAQAQLTLSKDDLKSLRINNGDPSSSGVPQSDPRTRPASSAQDSDFSTKFNRALSDVERKEQAAEAESARNRIQNQDMFRNGARPPNRNTDPSKDRTEIQISERGSSVCRKTEAGQTQCVPQSKW